MRNDVMPVINGSEMFEIYKDNIIWAKTTMQRCQSENRLSLIWKKIIVYSGSRRSTLLLFYAAWVREASTNY